MTKNPIFSNFQSFYAIFVKNSTTSVAWRVENFHQGNNTLSSSLLCRDKGSFVNENYLKLTPKMRKNTKFFNFKRFNAVFVKLLI